MADKLKDKETMTAGVTPSKLEEGMTIDLHGHSVKITSTDAEDTLVQYANLARRGFDTHALNGFLELGTFPVGTAFERPNERAVIEAVAGDCCYQVRISIGEGEPKIVTFSYADFIAWHMTNLKPISVTSVQADDQPEADDDTNPFEVDLQKRIEQLEADLATADSQILELIKDNFDLKSAINSQKQRHETIIAGYEQDIERLEAKATIFAPACKEFRITHDINKADLDKFSVEGWQIQHPQFAPDGKLNVLFVRDLPAAPAPKVFATDAAIYSTSAGRPSPIPMPSPMPANQTVIMGNAPVSRALTNNGPKPGDTKRIPSYMQHEADAKAFQDILERNAASRAAILSQPSRPFGQPSQE